MKSLRNKVTAGMQKGFTLIELVIVIVVIGILAAVAIPNFTNVTDDAKKAKADATAGALASWSSTNYARCEGKLAGAISGDTCSAAAMTAAGLTGTPSGTAAACVVTVDSVASSPVSFKTSTAC